MSARLAALAARVVGRPVRVKCPGCGADQYAGTVTRVTGQGFTVAVPGLTHRDVTFLAD